MNTRFNWAGLLCLGSAFFALLIIVVDAKINDGNTGIYAITSLLLALLAIPFSTINSN